MKIAYDSDVDILTIDFKSRRIWVSEEVLPGVIADFDPEGLLVGFEIMDAGKFGDYSEFVVFLSKWGDEERVLDADGNFSVSPRKPKAISAGD